MDTVLFTMQTVIVYNRIHEKQVLTEAAVANVVEARGLDGSEPP